MCRRSQEPGLGKWNLPSGFLEKGETLEEGAARETFEESGVVVDPGDLELHAVINMVAIDQVAIAFRIEVATKPAVSPGPECLEAGFLAEGDIPPEDLAWRIYLGNEPQRYFSEIRLREYTICLGTLGSSQRKEFKSREYGIKSVRNV